MILNSVDSEILKNKDSDTPQFCLFVAHMLRLLIVCSSIEKSAVDSLQEPSLKQVLRNYE